MTESWEDLARRFIRHEGGFLHFTEPAAELLTHYDQRLETSIYAHFRTVGDEIDARTYLTVYDERTQRQSPTDERIAAQYIPHLHSLVIWCWGEADFDPERAVLEEHDPDLDNG